MIFLTQYCAAACTRTHTLIASRFLKQSVMTTRVDPKAVCRRRLMGIFCRMEGMGMFEKKYGASQELTKEQEFVLHQEEQLFRLGIAALESLPPNFDVGYMNQAIDGLKFVLLNFENAVLLGGSPAPPHILSAEKDRSAVSEGGSKSST